MAQAKRKTATKTAKKSTTRRPAARKVTCNRTKKCKEITGRDRMHVFLITAMSIVAAILLCADAAMMIV